MKKTLFIVTEVIYDHYDNNLWSDAKVFPNEEEARAYLKDEGEKCLSEAQGQDFEDDPDNYYYVDRNETDDRLEYIRSSDTPMHYEIKICSRDVEL